MSIVRSGKSFKLLKKILCVILSITLCLMLLPSALFRTEAQAAAPNSDDVFVKADSDMTNFGQFAFNPNVSSANVSTYTQNDLLHVIGCKAETEQSIVDKATAQIKKSLTDDLHSVMNDSLPAAKEGFKTTLTGIDSIKSNLPCLSVAKVKITDKKDEEITDTEINNSYRWVFTTTNPNTNKDSGTIEINSKYAHYVAEYDVDLNGQSLTVAKEIVVNNKNFASGKIVITPQILNGKECYKLNVDLNIINVGTNPYKHAVSVTVDNSKTTTENVNKVNALTVNLKNDYFSNAQSMMTLEKQCTNLATIVNKSEKQYVLDDGEKVYLGIAKDAKFLLTDSDYKVGWSAVANVAIQTEAEGEPLFALYEDPERESPYTGTESLTITNNNFDVSAPVSVDSLDNYSFYDGGETESISPTEYFNVNTASKSIKVQANTEGEKLSTYTEEGPPEFDYNYCYPVKLSQKSSLTVPIKIYVCDNSGLIKKIDTTIMYQDSSNLYMGYEFDTSGLTPFDDFVLWAKNFFFAKDIVKVKFMFGKTEKEIASTKITVNGVEPEGLSYVKLSTDEKGITTQICSIDRSTGNYEIDMKDWLIQPFDDNGKGIIFKKTPVTQGMSNPTTKIIANALAPTKTSISWDVNGENRAPKAGELFKKDDKVSYKVIVIDESGMFEYTWKYAKEGPEKDKVDSNIVSAVTGPEGCKDTDFEKQNIIKISDLEHTEGSIEWSKTVDLNLEGDNEFDVNFTYKEIKDMLGREAQNSQATTNWNFGVDNGNPVLTVDYDPTSPVNIYHGNDGDEFYYQQGRTATICVKDLHFGESKEDGNSLIDVERSFKNENNVDNVSEKLGSKVSDWQHNDLDHTLVVAFPEQGDYNFVVSGTDRALNKLTGVLGNVYVDENGKYISETWTQDWRNPNLSVSWDNNNVISGKYYTAARTATFVMEERNFASEYINVSPIVTHGNDGTIGSANFSGWTSSGNNLWTCTVSYSSEGTYALSMDGIDKARNAMMPYSQSEFVIDWTKPNIQISGIENRQAYGDTAQPNVTITDANMSSGTTCQVESLGATKGHPYSASPSTTPAQYTYTYGNPEKVAENDGVYRINVNAVDMAGNSDVKEMVWSVNRFGSTYVIDSETETILDDYVNKDSIKDIVVTEINPSGVDNHSVEMTKGSFTETLKEGEDYTAQASGGDGSWYECVYTINKNFFKEDGKYTLNYYSKDKVGHDNENSMENKNAERNAAVNVQFVYDNAKPTVSYDNLSEGMYSESTHKAKAVFEDNSKKFREGKVIVNGDETYVSGADLEKNGYKIDFELKDSATPISIETVSIDKAGNEMNRDSRSVVVTMNPFLLWFYNTPVFVTTLVVAGLLIIGLGTFLIRRKIGKK